MPMTYLLVPLVLMETFASSSEVPQRPSGCSAIQVLPGESKIIWTTLRDGTKLYVNPTDTKTKIHITLLLKPFLHYPREEGHAFTLSDLCMDDLSKWHILQMKSFGHCVGFGRNLAFSVFSSYCPRSVVTDYWFCCSSVLGFRVRAEGGSLWRDQEPGPECLQSSSTPTEASFSTSTEESSSSEQRTIAITKVLLESAGVLSVIVIIILLVRRRRTTRQGSPGELAEVDLRNMATGGTSSSARHSPLYLEPIPSENTPISSGNSPIPSGNGPVPSENAQIPSGNAPIPSGNAPIPFGNAPIPSGNAPISSGNAPIPPGNAPIPSGSAPIAKYREEHIYEHIVCNDPHCRMSSCISKDSCDHVAVTVRIADHFRS